MRGQVTDKRAASQNGLCLWDVTDSRAWPDFAASVSDRFCRVVAYLALFTTSRMTHESSRDSSFLIEEVRNKVLAVINIGSATHIFRFFYSFFHISTRNPCGRKSYQSVHCYHFSCDSETLYNFRKILSEFNVGFTFLFTNYLLFIFSCTLQWMIKNRKGNLHLKKNASANKLFITDNQDTLWINNSWQFLRIFISVK